MPVRRQSRADTRHFSKGQNSVVFTLFAMCALSHNWHLASPLPLPPKKQISKTIASIAFNFPETTLIPGQLKTLGYAIFWGGKQGVLWEMCKCSVAKPFLVSVAYVAGVRKRRGRELGREPAHEGRGRRGTPARKPLFSPSRPLIKK